MPRASGARGPQTLEDPGAKGRLGAISGAARRRAAARPARGISGSPSLPSCGSFSITLSFSLADPSPHGPGKQTAIPRGRKQSFPCVCLSSSGHRMENMERGLRNNQEVPKSRRRRNPREERLPPEKGGREGERSSWRGREGERKGKVRRENEIYSLFFSLSFQCEVGGNWQFCRGKRVEVTG